MTIILSILFIFAALGVFFGAHYFFYYSLVNFFGIASITSKSWIFVFVAVLSVSFILATLLAHFRESFFTRGFYLLSSFWLGLLVNLTLASIIIWIIILVLGIAGYTPNGTVIGCVFFLSALFYSIYGSWNAFNPQVKNIQVTIKNLPEQWKGKNIVQLSDVHLGHIYRADFLAKIVKKTNALHPDAVVITGDLFDGMDGHLEDLVGPLNDLQVPNGVYFVSGNHETYLGADKAFSILEKTKVVILNDAIKNIDGLQFVGISYPERGQTKELKKAIETAKGFIVGKPTILLYHAPNNVADFKAAGVNLQLSGHTHLGQMFPFNLVTKIVYKGYDYGLYTMGDYSIYTTNGVGTWGPPMRTGNTPEIVNITLN